MGSTRCRHFVQNAWKKELCSNCFKSKDEHASAPARHHHHRQAVAPTPAAPPPQGILKGVSWTRSKTHRVYFPAEESEVIGEGGEDAGPPSDDDSDDGVDDQWTVAPLEDDPQEREDERLLQALTRSNTDFNSVASNLEGTGPPPKQQQQQQQQQTRVQGPLQLGRPQTDADGRKQTLLVSVQPFGGKPEAKPEAKPEGKSAVAKTPAASSSGVDHVTKIPVATPVSAPSTNNNVVLKSIVHTGSEFLPPITSPAPVNNNTRVPSSSSLSPSSPTSPCEVTGNTPTSTPSLLKLNDAQTTANKVHAAPLSSKHMFLKSIVDTGSSDTTAVTNGVSHSLTTVGAATTTAAVASAAKPTVTNNKSPTTTTTTVNGSSPPTVPSTKTSPAKTSPTAVLSSASAATTVSSSAVKTPVSSTVNSPARRDGRRTHITRGTPISKNNELLLKTKFTPLRTSTILNNTANNNNNSNSININNKRNNGLGPKEEGTLVKINGMRNEPVMLIEAKQIDSSDEDERTYSNVQVNSKGVDDEADTPGAQTKRLASLLAPLGGALSGPLGGVGLVGSRELAGEPDGRADPDSSSESGSEPPALPQSPPPAVDPRPSFLHGLTARLAASSPTPSPSPSRNTTPTTSLVMDKPRVPFKSSTVVQAATAAHQQQQQQQRWSQVGSSLQQQQQQQQQQEAKSISSVEAPQAPSCSPPSSLDGSPGASPHGTPTQGQAESCSRQQKRQAPRPPQEQQPESPSPSPVSSSPKELPSSTTSSRAALARSASTGSSATTTCSSPTPTQPPALPPPGASPPSPVPSYHRKSSLSSTGSSPHKDSGRRRASQHLLMMTPLPPLAPARSESVPSALGQVALGHSVTLGAHSGHSIAQALAQANSFVSMSPSAHVGSTGGGSGQQNYSLPGQPQPSPRRALSLSTDSLTGSPTPPKHVMSYDTERKKPGTKVRFSLRKFLGLTKEGSGGLRGESTSNVGGDGSGAGASAAGGGDPLAPPHPRPRPRLEIIHPSDLSGRAVEVLRASGVEVRRQLQEQAAQAYQSAATNSTPTPTSHLRDHRRSSDSSVMDANGEGSLSSLASPASPDHGGDAAVKSRPSKPPPPPRSQSLENDSSHSHGGSSQHTSLSSPSTRPTRPPPPKSAHVDLLMRRHQTSSSSSASSPPTSPGHSVYANVACVGGEMRPTVAPLKPQRSGSVRDATVDGPRRTPLASTGVDTSSSGASTPVTLTGGSVVGKESQSQGPQGTTKMLPPVRTCSLSSQPEDSGYESVELSDSAQPQSMTDSENVYECVNGAGERSSSPECDSNSKRTRVGGSSSGTGAAGAGSAGAGAPLADRPASVSAQYCGSETESDIYSPYSFYGSEEGEDQDGDVDGVAASSLRRPRKGRSGRSVVHKSMEENYDAVVGANLEALAQLLEQIRTGPTVPAPLRPLKTASALGWGDFSVSQSLGQGCQLGQGVLVAGRWAFLPAQWGCHSVTLAVLPSPSSGQEVPPSAGLAGGLGRVAGRWTLPFALLPIVEFTDRVPAASIPAGLAAGGHVQALVGVLARARVDTLSSYGEWLRQRGGEEADAENAWREAGLALLQLMNALLAVQALRLDVAVQPDSVVFLRDPSQPHATPQLALLWPHADTTITTTPTDADTSLCRCALAGVRAMLPGAPATPLLTSLLEESATAKTEAVTPVIQERLQRAKAVLEYWLWGPPEAVSSLAPLAALQRWLDLERATVLHRLVCARAAAGPSHRLAIHQQSHLLFLVHTTAAAMGDASRLLDEACVTPLEASS